LRQRANAPEALPPAFQAAQERVADLESQVYELQAARQADQQRITALETELADERSRREQAARSREASAQALSTATDGLDQAEQALASGSGDVSAAVARAQALTGEAARHAGAGGSGQEAVLAGEAQRWLALSQEALQRGDLFQARVAVDAASRAATQARALAGQ
jgi:chromosome segregation ATPase